MFGYLTPALGAMTEEQRSRYRMLYCGLCHALNRYGEKARLTLSHDLTFVALLLSSLYEPRAEIHAGRCLIRPVKAHHWETSSMIDFAADMNLLLFHYKCLDSKMDDGSIKAKTALNALRKPVEKIQEKHPVQSREVESALNALWALEKEQSPPADELCNLSGRMFGAVFVPFPDEIWAAELQSVGEGLGRFIYWMDAWEDDEADQRKGRFNPLAAYRSRDDFHDFCHDTLEMLMAEAVEHFELLPLEKNLDLLRNILYAGVWQRYQMLEKKQKRKGGAPNE